MILKDLKKLIVAGILLIALFQANNASALLVGTSEYNGSIFTRHLILISSVDVTPNFRFSSSPNPLDLIIPYQPFGEITIDSSSIGNQYSISMNDPYFSDTVSMLTNNFDDSMGTTTMLNYSVPPTGLALGGTGNAFFESLTLSGAGFNGTDFYGSTIDNITLTVGSFSSNYDTNQNGSGVRTEYSYSINYEQTVVPEPISSTLFIVGGAALGFRRLRKR